MKDLSKKSNEIRIYHQSNKIKLQNSTLISNNPIKISEKVDHPKIKNKIQMKNDVTFKICYVEYQTNFH